MRFVNDGKAALCEGDYNANLGVRLSGGNIRIMSAYAELIEASGRTGVPPLVTLERDRAIVDPVLLNKQDTLEIRLLVDGQHSEVEVLGRLAGFELNKRSPRETVTSRRDIAAAVIGLFALTVGLLFTAVLDNNLNLP